MNNNFVLYFFNFIYHSKTRQRLLLIAVVGLFISSFSLLVIQSVMGGLQSGLIKRSKNIHGDFFVRFSGEEEDAKQFSKWFKSEKIKFYPEYELEVVLRHKNYVTPAILRGVDFSKGVPDFLKNRDHKNLILGADLGTKLNVYFDGDVKIMSPSHLDTMLGTIPRQVSTRVSDFYISELSEVDSFQAWTRISLVQNLARDLNPNVFRVYDNEALEKVFAYANSKDYLKIVTWEEQNASLVKALRLETTVMFFLFISMSFLVAVSIISGFLIFYSKVKNDMMSFWILGLPQEKLFRLLQKFNISLGLLSSFLGLLVGLIFLFILDKTSLDIMPDVFVERKLPVQITWFGVVSSFAIPAFISVCFSLVSLSYFKRENTSFLKHIRSIS